VLVIGYTESANGGSFIIYNNWNTNSETTLAYANTDLSAFSDDNTYVEFENITAAQAYTATTFTTQNYPAP